MLVVRGRSSGAGLPAGRVLFQELSGPLATLTNIARYLGRTRKGTGGDVSGVIEALERAVQDNDLSAAVGNEECMEDAAALRELADALQEGAAWNDYDWTCWATGRGYSNCGGECLNCRLRRLFEPEWEAR